MRTTVTLEPETEALLRKSMRERGLSFKDALNHAICAGLLGAAKTPVKVFRLKTYSMGAEMNFRWDKALAAADAIEDEEILRKLALRK